MLDSDTIVAIATAPGRGGIGIVRLSGNLSQSIAQTLSKKIDLPLRQVCFVELSAKDGSIIDSGLLVYFKAPHSFTGEDVVELQVHGSPIVLDNLVNECTNLGARIARPGEFSERAFLNDKIDLTQAEAIADLINASSKTAARLAVRSLQGEFSDQINRINEQIIHLRIFVEAAIDFPEEEVDFLNDGHVENLLTAIIEQTKQLRRNAFQGSILQEGLTVVIAGAPNVGKSTLINALAGYDVAIVTDIPGTTRDVMRESILIDDLPVKIIDTAGLRESTDPVEQEGIRRAWAQLNDADVVLSVSSIDSSHEENNNDVLHQLDNSIPKIKVINKIDKLEHHSVELDDHIYISAKNGIGLSKLKDKIKQLAGYNPGEGQFLARRRHLKALDHALELLLKGKEQLVSYRAGELLAEDLRIAHQLLGEITGEFSADDLLGKIFSSFCIGK